MSTSWDYGYVSDVEYIPGFYLEQTPAHINTICHLNGVLPPVEMGEAFSYCELGCGLGETALIVAAASPNSTVWAFDFNPAHIAGARQTAQKTGTNNIHYDDRSFQQIAENTDGDIPQFDYITFHGVWSWVNDENRSYIVDFIAKHLKPGGIVYVSYNALPGWSNIIPMRKLLFLLANDEIGSSDQRALAALDKIKSIVDKDSRYLPKDFIKSISKSGSYLSHEYLNETWDPTFHIDVANDLARAKLAYLGSANIFENYNNFSFSPEQIEELAKASPETVETLKDYFLDRTFRRDLFIKGRRNLVSKRVLSRIEDCQITLTKPLENVAYEVMVPRGKANLNKALYEPVYQALSQKTQRIKELLDLPNVDKTDPNARDLLGILIGSKQGVISSPDVSKEHLQKVRDFNKSYISLCLYMNRTTAALACARTEQALTLNIFDMLVYEALTQGTDEKKDALAKAISKNLSNRDDKLIHDGKTIETEKETATFVESRIGDIISKKIPLWKLLGAL